MYQQFLARVFPLLLTVSGRRSQEIKNTFKCFLQTLVGLSKMTRNLDIVSDRLLWSSDSCTRGYNLWLRDVSDDQISCLRLSIKSNVTPSILNCVKFVSELHVTHVCVWKCSVEAGDNNVELAKEAGPTGSPQGRSPSIVPRPLITINSYIWKFWHATFIHSNLWTGHMKYLYLTNIRKRTSDSLPQMELVFYKLVTN